MQSAEALTYWAILPEIWLILAIILVGADLLFGFDFFVLSIGVAALALAGLLYGQNHIWPEELALFETWRDVGLWFAVLSVASIALIRLVVYRGRKAQQDINDY